MATEEIKAGAVVCFSTGCYSDYSVGSFARVLKPINEAVWKDMTDACTHPREWDKDGDPRFNSDEAVPWFVKNGYIEEVEYQELHLGDYAETPKWSMA